MSIQEQVAAQLAEELGGIARALGDVFGPDLRVEMETRLESGCRVFAAKLCSDDDRLAAEAVLTLICARWPLAAEPPPPWWRTPVGRMVARSVGRYATEAVTRSVAAAMLGVHPDTVARLVARGTLVRHPDGGIVRASVLARLADGGGQPSGTIAAQV